MDQYQHDEETDGSGCEAPNVGAEDGFVATADQLMMDIDCEAASREQVVAALMESNERYASIVENITIGITLLSPDMRVLDMNKQMREWFPHVNVEEHPVCYRAYYKKPDAEVCDYCPAVKAIQTGRVHDVEVPGGKDGARRYFYIRSSPVFGGNGEVTAVVEMLEDITERKQMTASLAQTDRMAGIGLLAAGVAHEINNPLMYVMYTLEKLARELPVVAEAMGDIGRGNFTPVESGESKTGSARKGGVIDSGKIDDLAKRAGDALEGADRIRRIVRDLKTFSRVEEDRQVPIIVNDIIEGAINMAFNEIKYRATVKKEYGRIPVIRANDGRLAQVFLNLLVNAAHSIDEGAVDNNEIRVKTFKRGSNIVIEVSDTGSGIEEKNLDTIFEPFFSTKEIGVGSGLGLSICRSIITSMGGKISVASVEGVGTTFTVEIPGKQSKVNPTAKKTDESSESNAPAVRGRIMIVDDEPGILGILRRVLGEDHEIIPVSSGFEARRKIEAGELPDLVLCDMMMPKMTGMDLYDWMATSAPSIVPKMVFITGGAFTPRAKRFLDEVDNLHLEKPIDLKNLRKMVRELVIAAKSR